MKACSQCGATKPFAEFYWDARGCGRYGSKCKSCIAARNKAYIGREDVKLHRAASMKAWYAAHAEDQRAQKRTQRHADIEATRAKDRAHYWSHREWHATIDKAIEMSGGLCAYCLEAYDAPAIDHVIPIAGQGENTADNIVVCCKSCNSRKRDRGVLYMLDRRWSMVQRPVPSSDV